MHVIKYRQIDSTQEEVWRKIENENEGIVVIADNQTNGIGTHGRKWYTEEGNISFSVGIKPNYKTEKLEGITIKIAQEILDVFKRNYKINLEIKEPNDIVKNGKKIGGILTQTKLQGNLVKCLVIGIGINTNKIPFNEATSIKQEWNIDIDNEKIISCLLERIEKLI